MRVIVNFEKRTISIPLPISFLKIKFIRKRLHKQIEKYISYDDFNNIYKEIFKMLKKYNGLNLVDIQTKENQKIKIFL